ncbi:site-specific tyrosine recombinase/integron integrase [Cytobacillus firmus]|uniref:site-specific tyrosine recombinase/integron integrase n=1 Tax=Cytobacillus firmus TaxID=1399 RepID=UPI0018CC91CA|nr:site-specific tyrosine recombinase/integron integrase [Cytobacillus firmus]MBG9548532.1 integrase [Cytobacillus firmus]MBG9602954.1 integrase [Cytobacillus firmus]MBG9654860.1 integrase [Cytobacillus firmus]MED1906133.1 tyrosine-type recombinase/integrase [Cytobacillus firmus]MED1941548.1 tyrosine-type recombinase/integrase [Cytobacillus firmus]
MNAGEQLMSDVAAYISELVPVNIEQVKNKLSMILTKYHVKKVEKTEVHPDLTEKIQLFLSAKKLEGLSPITLDSYLLELNTFSKKVKKRVEDITTAEIRVFLGSFEHLKLSSVSRKLSVLKSFFGWLTAEEFLQRDPTTKIKPPKKEKRLPKALTIEELELLRESCKTNRQRAFLEILYATGCRLSEVHALNKSDINYRTASCRVIGKGNKEREVYFSPKAMYHLRKYLMNRTDESEALMVTERRPYRRLSKRGIQREIGIIAKHAGLDKKISPHTMRHTFATLTLNNGADIAAVQALMGHEDPSTTQIYAQLTEEKKRETHKKYLVM